MMEPARQAGSPASIAVLLRNAANARLLERLLGGEYRLLEGATAERGDSEQAADLVVVDAGSLQRNRQAIGKLRDEAVPVVLPVLLVAEGRTASMSQLTAELGQSVDDILRIPTSRAELRARIDNLLRLRTLSRDQEEARTHLAGVVTALRMLNACDRIVVRSRSEQQLIELLCRTIVGGESYRLAWVGYAEPEGAGEVTIRASAGDAKELTEKLTGACLKTTTLGEAVFDAIRRGRPRIVGDITTDWPASTIRSKALEHGLTAVIVLPLKTETGPRGCLVIHSDTAAHFGEEERYLLGRLSANLGFGLNALRAQRERERQTAEIHDLAYTDALTGLPNRRHMVQYLDEILSRAPEEAPSGAILFVDLDGFKIINDALGHETGDEVLRQIGQRLEGSVRDSDLVVRQGGDEFLVLLFDDPRHPQSDQPGRFVEHAEMVAERIIARLSEPLTTGGHEHRLGVSIGISLYPQHSRDANTLIEHADTAMYSAKRDGGGRSHLFSPEIAAGRQRRFSMEEQLHRAFEHRAFALHYQPVFDLERCRITGAEALIRWPRENGETLMPGAFLPVAEEMGLIGPLGEWVLETAARQLAAWRERCPSLTMAVNVSANQLHAGLDAARLAELVRPFTATSGIYLEVTEDALSADPGTLERVMAALHEAGFPLAIDDFGTGFSSLSRLQHLPIRQLKIDRSFVNALGRDAGGKGASLVRTIYQMARGLSLETVAEGIETDDQRRLLLDVGPGYGQGFWLSPAVPAEAFESRLDAQGDTPGPR